jgi:hypothetical protein
MADYSFAERDLATLYMVNFRNMKKYGELSRNEVKMCEAIDNNDLLRRYFMDAYKTDTRERAEQTGIYTLTMDGRGNVGTQRFLQEQEMKETFERGLNVVVGGGLTGALSMEVARRLYPDNPQKQLALGELVAAGGELLSAAMETVHTRHEFRQETRENTAHGQDFKPVGEIEPAPPAEEKKPMELEKKEEAKSPEDKPEAKVPGENQFYQPTDYIGKKGPAEPFYKPEPVTPLKTDGNAENLLRDKPKEKAADKTAADGKPPVTQSGEGISFRKANSALNQGKTDKSPEQKDREKKDRPEKRERTESRKKSGEPKGQLKAPREGNRLLNLNKEKGPEKNKEIKEVKQEVKQGG